MLNKLVDQTVERIPGLDDTGLSISRSIHDVVLKGGTPMRIVADVLHGKGTGHPLHSVLTDVTVGAWLLGVVFDLTWLRNRSHSAAQAADALIAIGTASAIPTALSGTADYSTIRKESAGTGLLHALLNVANVVLFGASIVLRRNERREAAVALSLAALSTAGLAAMLGGHMSYSQRVGVNHDKAVEALPEWTTVGDLADLLPDQPKRVDYEGHPIMLYRHGDEIYAISAICSHAGGPLPAGTFNCTDNRCTVQCPWHQSVFNLKDGSVVHGPATQAVTGYETRVNMGQVQVRLPYGSK